LWSQIFDPPVGLISIKFKKQLKPCLVVVVSDIFQQRLIFSEELIMALETATYINGLVVSNPVATDSLSGADDHMRLIKTTIQNTFPNITGAITANQSEINVLDGITSSTAELNILAGVTATAAELNILDGVTATAAELNTLDGVTSTAAEINTLDGITATTTELNYLTGVTSNIQTQFSTLSTTVSNVNIYPMDVRVLTSGTSYTIPAGAKAILIKASGGGGGGSIMVNPGSGNLGINNTVLGGDGGTTTLSNSTLGVNITAAGGPHGTNMAAGSNTTNWFTNVGSSSAGGDIFYNAGASGGRSTTNNFDGGREDGGNGVLVQKYVTAASLSLTTIENLELTYAIGAGGTAHTGTSLDPEAGRDGYIELWIW